MNKLQKEAASKARRIVYELIERYFVSGAEDDD